MEFICRSFIVVDIFYGIDTCIDNFSRIVSFLSGNRHIDSGYTGRRNIKKIFLCGRYGNRNYPDHQNKAEQGGAYTPE